LAVGSIPTGLTKPQHIVVFLAPDPNISLRATPEKALVDTKALVEPAFSCFCGYFLGTYGILRLDIKQTLYALFVA
jgi:DhnA family fructose-bisphosphate aldolase class Ia